MSLYSPSLSCSSVASQAAQGLEVLPVSIASSSFYGVENFINLSFLELFGLAVVPVLNGAVVARYTRVNFRGFAANGAFELFADKISVVFADGIRRGKGVVRELIIFPQSFFNERGGCLPVGESFALRMRGTPCRKCKAFAIRPECRAR